VSKNVSVNALLFQHQSGKERLVLIVDDDLASRELLASYLEPESCKVVMVSSGTEAVEEASSLPDLIVTEVLMPGPGGLQTRRNGSV